MKESTYCPLHQHTFYSLGDSCCTPQEIAEVLSDHGITACAITEHGNMFSIQEAYLALKKKNIKLIPGIEVYVAEHGHSRFERPKKKSKKDKENDGTEYNENSDMNYNYCHLILLAKDYNGYKNLIQIASEGFNEESFYYKPRVDFEYIKEHKEGLIVLSACLAGNINRLIVEGKYEEAKQIAKDYKDVFGKENFFLECQYHGIPEENIMNDGLLKIAQELDLNVVITNDSHSAYKEDALPHGKHDVLVTSKYKQNIDDPNRTWVGAYGCGQHYIKGEEEMRQLPVVSKHPELIENTKKIADMCSFDYAVLFEKPTDNPSGMHIPIVDFDKTKFKDDKEYLKFRVYEGLNKIFNNNIPANYKKQADYEVEVISDLGFASYMLTQQNFMKITEDAGVTHGVGRGCVSQNTLIHTPSGLVEISKLKPGDFVLSSDGKFHAVLDTMKYPVYKGETLLRPIVSYGDSMDLSHFFTKNHKVLCIKASKVENPLPKGKIYNHIPNPNPEWIEVSKLEPGDLLFKPMINSKENEHFIQFLDYNEEGFKTENGFILETKVINGSSCYRPSIREVSRCTGLSRNAVKAFLDTNGLKTKQTTKNKLSSFLNNFDLSLEEWSNNVVSFNRTPYVGVKIPEIFKVDKDFAYFLGYMTGDGWIRSIFPRLGICFAADKVNFNLVNYIRNTFSIELSEQKSKTTNLISYTFSSKLLYRFFKDFWSGYDFTARTKTFPDWIFSLPYNVKLSFVKGLMDSDGCTKNNTFSFDSSSWPLISKMATLLSTMNISYSISKRDSHFSQNAKAHFSNDSWKLKIVKGFKEIRLQRGQTHENFVLKRIIRMEECSNIDFVYDITVQDTHDYVTNAYVAHNSAAGSIVSYALGITGIDPIKYNLIFERFLAPGGGRVSLPDIDVDFSDKAAAYKAIEDVYGKERVAHVLNITYLKARSSLQEVARILDFTPKESDEITKLIPEGAIDITLKEALDTVQDIKSRYNSDPKFKRLFDLAMKIEGLGYNTGVHASATIVADKPIAENYVQTMTAEKSKIRCIGLQGSECEKNYLIKFDLLGLSNLNFIDSTKQQLLKTRPELPPIDFAKIEIKDHPLIFKSLYEDTLGIFQFESAGMGGTLKQMLFDINKLDSMSVEEQKVAAEEFFERMMAAVALYRPGPMDNIPQYISNMKNPSGTKYIEDVKGVNREVLRSTYGVMVYQESLMEILRLMSGQDYSFSDRARRAIAKKHLEDLPKLKGTFIEGAIAQGNTKEIAEKVWKAIEDGSGYSFNKAHACAYAYIGWQTAYLKHYFEPEYFCSILSNSEGDDLKKYISACKNKLGIKIVHPDINLSETKFTTRVVDYSQPLTLPNGRSNKDNFEIVFGLEGINGVSSKTALPIIQERTENGPFSSFEDFISRCESFISSDVLINLIRTGCFDNLDNNRFKLEYNAKKLLDNIKKKKKQEQTMAERIEKEKLLAEEEGREPKEIKNRFKPLDLEMEFVDDLSIDDRAFREKASANMFFEYNPLSKFKKDLVSLPQNHTIQDIISNKNISKGTFIVVLSNVKKKVSKNSGKQFATCTISDLTGEAEAVIYETVLNAKENLLVETKCLCVKCNIKNDRGTPTLVVNDIFEADDPQLKQKVLEDAGFKKQVNRRESYDRYDIDKSEFEKGIHVQIENRQDLSDAVKFFEPFKGMSKVFFYIKDSKYSDSVYFGDVRANTEESGFERELIQRFGEENVKIV